MKKFPTLIQYDSKDCGPTCLQIILKYYKKEVSINSLKKLCETTRLGTSLNNINKAANELGIDTLILKIDFESLKRLFFPCIVHWNKEHYVVVYKIQNDKVYVSDPAFGRIIYSVDDFKKFWISYQKYSEEGIVLLLEPNEKFETIDIKEEKSVKNKITLLSILKHLKNYSFLNITLLISIIIGIIIQFSFPLLTQSIVDVGIVNNDISFIYLLLLFQLFLFLGKIFNEIYRNWFLIEISTRINITLISDFFIKLMKLPISFFDIRVTGDLLQRIDDHKRIEKLLTTHFLTFLQSILIFIVFGLLLFYYDGNIFLVFMGMSIFQLIWVTFYLKRREVLDYKRFSTISQERSTVIELINGMHEIKINNAENRKRWGWENFQVKLFNISLDSLKIDMLQNQGALFISEVKNILITFLAAKLVIQGELTLGAMLSISYILGQLVNPISFFIDLILQIQDTKISLKRIGEIYNMKEENEQLQNKIEPGNIQITNLSFKYSGTDKYAIKNLSVNILKNKVTAIVGQSGSGKTTLLKLLLKYYDDYSGDILVDNVDLKKISSSNWRESIGVVLQDGHIFNDTVANNISISSEEVDRDKLTDALKIACIYDFVISLPYGFDTKIGNEGLGLSGGQKQRILIARAIYKNPSILIFDEATSSLDAENENMIISNLISFFLKKTVIIIAHRLSTVKNADQILVLKDGIVQEIGDHKDLVNKKGEYYSLVKNQLELAQ
ncbi:peptidase domain-containing ABC transporter [Belliella pelovolcani]|uniref:ATP-binding cassette, subfamily B n=1 Tax=Belliella pelovolcani TaxID=529505 RepID=A0A1N7Q4P0_9BACT|nr:peptidase domain-containing ABC transporter [Belliella pelovolcani]SIT17832.1 ATP-binding cassette, subfamily B [Belliella pelovolcani]